MQTTESLTELESVVRPHLKFLKEGDSLDVEQDLGEVGLDSMASIDLLLDLEDYFKITIQDDLITENSFLNLVEIQILLAASQA